MRFGSLFAGIGGLDLGLERAGMECAWQVEWDEFCTKVLTKHWPDVPKYGDIRDVGRRNLEPVDLICGGFPCQPFSVAGKQRGEEDDRHLWPEMLRVISELKPAWVIGENVPGIISLFLDTALSDLEAEGYTCETFVLPACGFDAPHKRDRLFIIANYAESGCRHGGNHRGGGYIQEDIKRDIAPGKQEREGREYEPSKIGNVRGAGPLADTTEQGLQKRQASEQRVAILPTEHGSGEAGGLWSTEPGVGRVADGVPNRVDRLRSLGNAVVPQVAEHIGRMILAVEGEG